MPGVSEDIYTYYHIRGWLWASELLFLLSSSHPLELSCQMLVESSSDSQEPEGIVGGRLMML